MRKYREQTLTPEEISHATASLTKRCEICNKLRIYHTREQALQCNGAIANDPNGKPKPKGGYW